MISKYFVRAFSVLLILSVTAISFAGCGENGNTGNKYRSMGSSLIESQILSENENYELLWDSDARAVILRNKGNGKYISDIAYDKYLNGEILAALSSPISITVANTKTLKWDTLSSFSQLENSSVVTKKLDSGIRVTYFFDAYEIAVPVDYSLNSDSVIVEIDSSKILENGNEYKLVSVQVAPELCSVKNNSQGGSLFVPTGSGAIIYTAEGADSAKEYTCEIFGRDDAGRTPISLTDDEEIKVPVFGAYGDGFGTMCVINQGAAACEITAQAGNSRVGYSDVSAVFYVRGYDEFSYVYHGKYQGITKRINEDISGQKFRATYYPLYGDEADYNGMANKYRGILISDEKGGSSDGDSYAVTLLGGTATTVSILGIPKTEILALTTFGDAENIIKDLSNITGISPAVRLKGFGDNGIKPGKIAGGKTIPSVYGGTKQLESLLEFCSDKLFFDFEIVDFSKSGAGFSINFDVAKTAILYNAEHYPTDPLRVNDEENVYYTLARNELQKALNTAIDKAQKYNIQSISLSSLGYAAYSDEDYIAKKDIEKDISDLLSYAKSGGYKIATSASNSYAAKNSDIIFDISCSNGEYDAFDLEVPFYQMVFHGYVPMYSEAVNLEANADAAFAKAVAFGMGIGYTLTNNFIDNSDDFGEYKLYGTLYSDNRDLIKAQTEQYSEIYNQTKDAYMVSYTIENGVSITEFSNGKTLTVNHTGEKTGNLKPYEFILSKG